MSAYNPPCQAELTFMHVLPLKMTGMTEAMTKLATSMDRLAAAVEKHNELVERNQVSVQQMASDMALGLPPKYANLDEIERAARDARRAEDANRETGGQSHG